ncbi:MAG: nucleotidyl transferase AbiEii/AbiGii toxin family protein [Parcubacteria group bacterium]
MNNAYRDQVRLLLDVLPLVAEEKAFALKGGTAINLFERDLPRLSVDIDLTYLPFDAREPALTGISEALQRVKARIERTVANTRVTLVGQAGELEAKLHCQRGRVQIKVEVNPTLRGHLLPTRLLACTPRVQEEFEVFVETPVVSHGELFGGKICAALDRQHPRDLFDVHLLLDAEGVTDEVRLGFIAALLGHGRPINELLGPTPKDQRQAFDGQFAGMAFIDFSYDDHAATLMRLVEAITASLTAEDKAFLLAFKAGEPDWTLFPLADAAKLPAVQWKLGNLRKLKAGNPAKHAQSLKALEHVWSR